MAAAVSWAPATSGLSRPADLSLDLFQLDRALDRHLVDDPERLGLLRRHEMIAIQSSFNGFVGLAGVIDVDFVEPPLDLENVLGMPLDVGGLTLESAGRLMNHDSRIGQREARSLLPGGEQKRAHRRRLPDAHRRYLRADELHRIVDREPRGDDAA